MSYMMFAQVATDQIDENKNPTDAEHNECEKIFYDIVTKGDPDNFVVKTPRGNEYAFCLWLKSGQTIEHYLAPFCGRLRAVGFKLRVLAYEYRDVEFDEDGTPVDPYAI